MIVVIAPYVIKLKSLSVLITFLMFGVRVMDREVGIEDYLGDGSQ